MPPCKALLIGALLLFLSAVQAQQEKLWQHSVPDKEEPVDSVEESALELDSAVNTTESPSVTSNGTYLENGTTPQPPVTLVPAPLTFVFYLKMSLNDFNPEKFAQEMESKLSGSAYFFDVLRPLYQSAYSSCTVEAKAEDVGDGLLKVTVTVTGCGERDEATYLSFAEDVSKKLYPNAEFYKSDPTKKKTGLEGWEIGLIAAAVVVVAILIVAAIAYKISRNKRVSTEYEMQSRYM